MSTMNTLQFKLLSARTHIDMFTFPSRSRGLLELKEMVHGVCFFTMYFSIEVVLLRRIFHEIPLHLVLCGLLHRKMCMLPFTGICNI